MNQSLLILFLCQAVDQQLKSSSRSSINRSSADSRRSYGQFVHTPTNSYTANSSESSTTSSSPSEADIHTDAIRQRSVLVVTSDTAVPNVDPPPDSGADFPMTPSLDPNFYDSI